MSASPSAGARLYRRIARWLDNGVGEAEASAQDHDDRVDWLRCAPFLVMHGLVGLVFLVGVSWTAVAIAVGLYVVRMFAITGFYHRYFSHRTFRTSRPLQFGMAVLGSAAVQRGPIWWAAHHRHHHVHSDEDPDLHSPRIRGFIRSHMGWFMTRRGFRTPARYVRDWLRYPELRLVDRFDWLVPVLLAAGLYALGELLPASLGTSGWQLFIWGFVVSTVVLYHCTYTINSLAHRWGSKRFATDDDSRNNFWLALITLGEGWHNNHHHYPATARQGFYWWEIDLTYYGLVILSWAGLIWDLRGVPDRALDRGRVAPDQHA